MNKHEKQVSDLILTDPDGGRMVISSELRPQADGALRFTVTNPQTGRRFGVYLGLSELTPETDGSVTQVGNVVAFRPCRLHDHPGRDRVEMLIEMAYQLKLVPRGDLVPVEFLELVGKQYDAAMAAAGISA